MLVINGVVVATAARTGWTRVRGLVGLRPPRAERRRAAYADDVAFIASLGLDPGEVLGPPPEELVRPGQ